MYPQIQKRGKQRQNTKGRASQKHLRDKEHTGLLQAKQSGPSCQIASDVSKLSFFYLPLRLAAQTLKFHSEIMSFQAHRKKIFSIWYKSFCPSLMALRTQTEGTTSIQDKKNYF